MKKPSAKNRRAVIGFLVLLAGFIGTRVLRVNLPLEKASLDMRYRHWNRSARASPEVVVIDIDEQSLKLLAPYYGRWPWPRRVYKDLVEFIGSGEPRGILFDLLFSESGTGIDDGELGAASAASGRVSHAINLLEDRAEDGDVDEPLPDRVRHFGLSIAGAPETWLRRETVYHDFVLPVGLILDRAPSLHVVTFELDNDGRARRAPLLFRYQDTWLPSLALQGVLDFLPGATLDFDRRNLWIRGRDRALRVPIGRDGTFPIHYYRPGRSPSVIPLAAVMGAARAIQSGSPDALKDLKVNPDEFSGKIVIVGTSAVGLSDLKATPIQTLYPGSLVQATAISNILQQDFLRTPAAWQQLLVAALEIGAVYASFFGLSWLWARIAVSTGFICGIYIAGLLSFRWQSEAWPQIPYVFFGTLAFLDGIIYTYLVEWNQRRKLQGTLSKYLAPVVIQEIIASGEDPRAEIGQHREVTTMFADLKGFTGLSESAPPELVVARLNEYLGRMIDVIFNHQGTLDKFIGDAIMSFWGAPLADPLQGLRSVRCAMAMHQGVEILGQEWRQQGKHELTFSTRIGINTGKVIVGNIGSEKHLSYTVIGDQVNLASRLEGLTRYYGVTTLVGERTAELIRGEICCRLIERRVIVKGKAEHVKVFEPLCELSAPDAAVLRELAGRFEEALELYREGKFEWARRLFHELATGRPGGDVPSRLYVERCEQLIAKPPREWDGTYVATSK